MDGYAFERFFMAPSPRPADALPLLVRTGVSVHAAARKHDVIHVQGEVASLLCLPSLAVRPSVVTFNGLNLLRRLTGPRRLAAQANMRLIVRAASRTICVAESEHEEVIGVVGRDALHRLTLIRNSVEPATPPSPAERIAARAAFDLSESTTVGVWLAGLDEVKDPTVPVRAAIELVRSGAPLQLLIAGDGPLRSEIERLVDVSGVDAVKILGFRQDTRRVLAAADFFVLSSTREGLSFSLLEAMSMAVPPVVSDAPGNVDAVGNAGVIVRRGDVEAFSAGFQLLLGDETARRALGESARARVVERFSITEMVQRTRDVYDAVLEERGPRGR